MGVVLFFVMALIAGVAVVYPLLPGRVAAAWVPEVTDDDIEAAVRGLRHSRSRGGSVCPTCGAAWQAGDRFCVKCGSALAQAAAPAPAQAVCPKCGAALHAGDLFCARCGHTLRAGEAR